MNLENDYLKHQGMIARVLGRSAMIEGEGVFPYLQACRTFDPKAGSFSTWLWHNLMLYRREKAARAKPVVPTIPFDENDFWITSESTEEIIERRDSLREHIRWLPKDAKTIIRMLFEAHDVDSSRKRRRINWGQATTTRKTFIRNQLRTICLQELKWTPHRFWRAMNHIEKMVKGL